MAGDWIKMHRKTLNSAVADDMTMLGCWSWILMNANWQKRSLLNGVTLKPGQLMVGMDRLASAWKCSKSTAHARTQKLQKLGMVTIKSRTDGTVITICKWRTYQEDGGGSRTMSERKPNARPNDSRTQTERGAEPEEEGKKGRRIRKEEGKNISGRFTPPTEAEVRELCDAKAYGFDPEAFVAFYAARNWVLSNGRKMADWRQACVTWHKNEKRFGGRPTQRNPDDPRGNIALINSMIEEERAKQ